MRYDRAWASLDRAGAGTGKTATLVARMAHLLEQGAVPERVCLLTFSRRAATEMLTRAGHLAAPALATRVTGGTFHAVCHQLLRHYGHIVGVDPGFSLLDAGDTVELIGLVRHDLGLGSGMGARFPRKETLAGILSQVANAQERLSDVVAKSFPWCSEDLDGIRAVFAGYTARKRAQRLCDFDDLLLLARALGASEVGGRVLAGLFDHVLVDEYQDVNALQADLVEVLRPAGRGVTAVGRRRPGHLRVPGGTTASHRRVLVPLPAGDRGEPRAQLPFDAGDPGRCQSGDGRRPRGSGQDDCGRNVWGAGGRSCAPVSTRRPRPKPCAIRCSVTGRTAWPYGPKPCCFGPAITPTGSRSLSAGGAFPTSNMGVCGSSRRPT